MGSRKNGTPNVKFWDRLAYRRTKAQQKEHVLFAPFISKNVMLVQVEIRTMVWSPRNPDLNPIKHNVKQQGATKTMFNPPKYIGWFLLALIKTWNQIENAES